MNKRILYGGIDVDDKNFHLGLVDPDSGEVLTYTTRPNSDSLIKKLQVFKEQGYEIKVCYEAGYLGYSLCRQLLQKGYGCAVIASSLIPQMKGHPTKTDKLDCIKLGTYYAKGLLTEVYIPDETEEAVRAMIRSRHFLKDQLKAIKTHIVSLCRRMGWDYRQATEKTQVSYWTKAHVGWLDQKIRMVCETIKFNLTTLINTLKYLQEQIRTYDEEIQRQSQSQKYKTGVEALQCYRGIETLTAMGLICEFGDIRRFAHPRQMTSYVGLDIREYSSGGKEKKFGITKLGNRFLRTSLVEACQTAHRSPSVSRRIQARRAHIHMEFKSIADRCMQRLYRKSQHLLKRGKPSNKVKVACAREMLGFIWESLNKSQCFV